MKYFIYSLLLYIFSTGSIPAQEPEPARVKEITKMLANEPVAPGPVIQDRKAWEKLSEQPMIQKAVKSAEKNLQTKLPEITDDLYLEFSRNGNRTHWQDANGKYVDRLRKLVLAECVENKGRLLPEIERLIKHFCDARTWVMPAHDRDLRNFYGRGVDIDLAVSMLGWELANIDAMLGDKLSAATRKMLRENLEKRVYTPFEKMIKAGKKSNWWLTGTNNWNAVCLAGVIGSALPIIESPERRAFFIASAEKYVQNFLRGFTPDGNCSEGLGYWNYGFGHFVMLAETIARSTGGKQQLMDDPQAFKPALYGFRVVIQDGVYPAFADCGVDAKPNANLLKYINHYYGLGIKDFADDNYDVTGTLYSMMLYAFPDRKVTPGTVKTEFDFDPLRSWFPDAGIYIGRKKDGKKDKLAVACKGGNNDEHHNHNDVGTFIVAVENIPLLCDPGAEVYTARTFSKDRYVSQVLNSFGHPVPVIGGKLQQTGDKSQGKILKTAFSEDEDRVLFDIKSAYPVPTLKKLERDFVYSRKGQGSLTVTDTVEFSKPETFETALVTFGKWQQNDDGSLLISHQGKAVKVQIDAGGKTCEIRGDVIREDIKPKTQPTRIEIRLKEPVKNAQITMTITPAEYGK